MSLSYLFFLKVIFNDKKQLFYTRENIKCAKFDQIAYYCNKCGIQYIKEPGTKVKIVNKGICYVIFRHEIIYYCYFISHFIIIIKEIFFCFKKVNENFKKRGDLLNNGLIYYQVLLD